jgi:hypothetical protein
MSSNDEKIRAEVLLAERWRQHTEVLHRTLPFGLQGDGRSELGAAVDVIGRLRSWIATWGSLVDDPRLDGADTRLATVHASLTRVAEVDAMHASVVEAADRVAFARLATSSLQRELVHRRHSARDQARATLDAAGLLDEIEMIDGTIQFRPEAGKRAVRVLPQLAKAQWRNLLRRVEELDDPVTPESFPRVRAATARCGDNGSDLTAAVGKPARRYTKAMTRLHRRLSGLHHVVLTADFLDHRGRVGGPTSATNAGLLRGVTLTVVAEGLERWPEWWADASRKKLRTWW